MQNAGSFYWKLLKVSRDNDNRVTKLAQDLSKWGTILYVTVQVTWPEACSKSLCLFQPFTIFNNLPTDILRLTPLRIIPCTHSPYKGRTSGSVTSCLNPSITPERGCPCYKCELQRTPPSGLWLTGRLLSLSTFCFTWVNLNRSQNSDSIQNHLRKMVNQLGIMLYTWLCFMLIAVCPSRRNSFHRCYFCQHKKAQEP